MAQVEIRELNPATDDSHLEQLLEAYLEIFNHPDNLVYLSLTQIPFEGGSTRKWLSRSQDEGRRYFAVVDEGDKILALSVAVDASVFADNDATLRLCVGSGFTPVRMTHHLRADGGDIVHLRNYLNREQE